MRFVRAGGGYNASHVAAEVDLLEPRQLLSATGGGSGEEEENSGAASPAEAWARYQDRVAIADGDYERAVDTAIGRYQSRTETADARLRTVFAAQNALFDTAAREAVVAFGEAGRIATTQYDAALDGADAALEGGVRAALGTHTAALETADAKRDAAVLAATEAFGDAAAAETIKYGEALKSAEAAYRGKVYEADLEFLARAITAAETFEAAESDAWTQYDAELKAADERYDAALAAIDAGETDRLAPAWGAYGAALQAAEDALEAAYDSSDGGYDGGYDESGDYEDPYAAAERAYDRAVAAAEQALSDAYDAVWEWRQGEEALAAFELYDSRQQAETDVYRKLDEAQALREAAVDAAHAEWVPKEAAAWTDHGAEVATADDEYADALLAPAARYDERIAAANAAWDAAALTANKQFLKDYAEASWGWAVEEMGASFDLLVAEVTAQEQFDDKERTAKAAYDSRMHEALDEWHDRYTIAEADLRAGLAEAESDWTNREQQAFAANAAAFTAEGGGFRAHAPAGAEGAREQVYRLLDEAQWRLDELVGEDWRKTFLDTLDDDVKGHIDSRWQVHHRYERAIGTMLEHIDENVRLHETGNLRMAPDWVHRHISSKHGVFWQNVKKEVERSWELRGLPKLWRGNPKYTEIYLNHPDKEKLAGDYRALVELTDREFEDYWLKPGAKLADLDNLAKNLGTTRGGIFSRGVISNMRETLRDREGLFKMMAKRAIRTAGIMTAVTFAVNDGVAFAEGADSKEMKDFIREFEKVLEAETDGRTPKREEILDLAQAFDDYLHISGVSDTVRGKVAEKFALAASELP